MDTALTQFQRMKNIRKSPSVIEGYDRIASRLQYTNYFAHRDGEVTQPLDDTNEENEIKA